MALSSHGQEAAALDYVHATASSERKKIYVLRQSSNINWKKPHGKVRCAHNVLIPIAGEFVLT